MLKSKITFIGQQAIDDKQPLFILFGEEATDRLREVSAIQRFETDMSGYALQAGSTVEFDDQKYQVDYVGELVKDNLTTIGHTVFSFTPVPDNPQANMVYVHPYQLPEIKKGTEIKYN